MSRIARSPRPALTRWAGAGCTTTSTAASSGLPGPATGSSRSREKMLDVNAALLRVYLDAGATLGLARFGERGADVLRYVQTWLADPVDGGWWGSQQADAAYYAAGSIEERRTRTAPPVGCSVVRGRECRDGLGRAARRAACSTTTACATSRIKSLERVLLACYKPGAGVAHYVRRPRRRPRSAGRPVRDGVREPRRFRSDRKHRLRDDGRGTGALCGAHDVGRDAAADSSIVPPRTPETRGRPHARPVEAVCRELRSHAHAASSGGSLGRTRVRVTR